jgi:dolichol-phosphate mannosyltransferase
MRTPEPQRAIVVLPTYNEAGNLRAVVAAIHEAVPSLDVLVVDDRSPDGTGELADQLAAADARVTVLHREGKRGLGPAYVAGFREALARGYDLVVQMDADCSHDPRYLPAMLALARDADVVIGSRNVEGGGTVNWGVGRQLLSQGGSLYARTVLGMPVRDMTAGFKCWRRAALEAVGLESVGTTGYAFQVEMSHRAYRRGLRLVETPIVFVDRRVGQSKMSRGIVLEALVRVWAMRLRGPLGGVRRPRPAGRG